MKTDSRDKSYLAKHDKHHHMFKPSFCSGTDLTQTNLVLIHKVEIELWLLIRVRGGGRVKSAVKMTILLGQWPQNTHDRQGNKYVVWTGTIQQWHSFSWTLVAELEKHFIGMLDAMHLLFYLLKICRQYLKYHKQEFKNLLTILH